MISPWPSIPPVTNVVGNPGRGGATARGQGGRSPPPCFCGNLSYSYIQSALSMLPATALVAVVSILEGGAEIHGQGCRRM